MSGLLKDNHKLLLEYDFSKNTDIDVNVITEKSGKKVWWKFANCGHEWIATIKDRNNGQRCPKCNKSKRNSVVKELR